METENPKEEMTLEEGFARLEELTAKMESGSLTLEEMYGLYKEGLDLVRECGRKIDTVEKDMQLLNPEGEDEF